MELSKLSLSQAHIVLPLRKAFVLCAFQRLIVFGHVIEESFSLNGYFSVKHEQILDILKLFVKIIKFFSEVNKTKHIEDFIFEENESNIFKVTLNIESRKVYFLLFAKPNILKSTFEIEFDIGFFLNFLNAFKIAIIPSFNLSFEQNLFFHFMLKKGIPFEDLKHNPFEIINIVNTFLTTFKIEKKANLYLIESFDYYIDFLNFITKIDVLLTASAKVTKESKTNM